MKTMFRLFLVWVIILGVLVTVAVYFPTPTDKRRAGAGWFSTTDAAGKVTGCVYWGNLENGYSNRIDFVLLLPVAIGMGEYTAANGQSAYRTMSLQLKGGNSWFIEALGDLNSGAETLRFHGLAGSVRTNYQFEMKRRPFWEVSTDGKARPLKSVDPAILERVLRESKSLSVQSAPR